MKEDILSGWKEIEMYLGINRKAVIAQGYPVRKTATGMIRAFKDELDRHTSTLEFFHATDRRKQG